MYILWEMRARGDPLDTKNDGRSYAPRLKTWDLRSTPSWFPATSRHIIVPWACNYYRRVHCAAYVTKQYNHDRLLLPIPPVFFHIYLLSPLLQYLKSPKADVGDMAQARKEMINVSRNSVPNCRTLAWTQAEQLPIKEGYVEQQGR